MRLRGLLGSMVCLGILFVVGGVLYAGLTSEAFPATAEQIAHGRAISNAGLALLIGPTVISWIFTPNSRNRAVR